MSLGVSELCSSLINMEGLLWKRVSLCELTEAVVTSVQLVIKLLLCHPHYKLPALSVMKCFSSEGNYSHSLGFVALHYKSSFVLRHSEDFTVCSGAELTYGNWSVPIYLHGVLSAALTLTLQRRLHLWYSLAADKANMAERSLCKALRPKAQMLFTHNYRKVNNTEFTYFCQIQKDWYYCFLSFFTDVTVSLIAKQRWRLQMAHIQHALSFRLYVRSENKWSAIDIISHASLLQG